ncbi:MAG: hypothetical protein AD742_03450 [Methylibium sp. NZG]|nr:MAG: hypothetical protein AD742_03450 [Methylibium sp. NZG]
MPGPAEAAVFASAVLVLNASPGVDLLLTASRTLQGGARAGAAAALGINAGCVVHALLAAFGLAALLALHPGAFRLVQWAGAAYLAWLGIGMLRSALGGEASAAAEAVAAGSAQSEAAGSAQSTAAASVASPPPPYRWQPDFRAGLLTNLLNPKVALFFLAFMPQFVPAASPAPTVSFLLLSAWFVVQSLLFLLILVAVVARLPRLRASGAVRRVLGVLGGALFIALAVRLLRERPAALG